MLKKLPAAVASRVSLITYLIGAGTASFGAALVYLPAGVIAVGLFLVALVIETGGSS